MFTHEALLIGDDIDVTAAAHAAGLRLPAVVSHLLWNDIANIPPALYSTTDTASRLAEVLWCGRMALERQGSWGHPQTVQYAMVLPIGTAQLYEVKLVVAHDSDGDLALYFMQPGEALSLPLIGRNSP